MKIGALIGWGIVIYAIMYLLWAGMVMHGFTQGIAPRILSLVILIATATIAGRSLRFHSWKDILPYSIAWTIIVAALDGLYSVPFAGWQLYTDWNIWVGYLLVACVPLFAPYTRPKHLSPDIT